MTETESQSQDPIVLMREAYERRDSSALRHQGRRMSFARFTVILGPIGVTLLSVQVVMYPHGGAIAVGLIALELGVLFIALLLGFFEIGQSHYHWIRERIRAEMLRRDNYFLEARTGPYLDVPDSRLLERVRSRLRQIDSEFEDPINFLMREFDEIYWRFAAEDSQEMSHAPLELDLVERYLKERVDAQREWFELKSRQHGHRAHLLEQSSRFVLVLAMVLASAHLYLLTLHLDVATIVIAALTLPAVAAGIVGFQSIFGSRHLNRSYELAARSLTYLASDLGDIRAALKAGEDSNRHLKLRFQRMVLEGERVIAEDLRRWWLTVYPEAPSAGA